VTTAPPAAEDERWERLWFSLSPERRAVLDEALSLAGKVLGPTSPRWERFEALCQEYLGAHPGDEAPDDPRFRELPDFTGRLELARAEAILEKEYGPWPWLRRYEPVAAVALAPEGGGARALDAELRRLVRARDGWDEVMGHLALLLQMQDLSRFDFNYCPILIINNMKIYLNIFFIWH